MFEFSDCLLSLAHEKKEKKRKENNKSKNPTIIIKKTKNKPINV